MKILGFGKKDDIDERMIGKHVDNSRRSIEGGDLKDDAVINNVEDDDLKAIEENDNREEDTSDYIDPDELNCDTYNDIVDNIEYNRWNAISSIPYPITSFDKQIVSSKQVKVNCRDIILEIVCPPERILAICGIKECGIDPDDFYGAPNFYKVPHFFTLRCTDNNDIDISPTTIISILKVLKDKEPEICYQEFYGDLSPVVDGKLKHKENRYYFSETIVLQCGEKLIFRAENPNIDIFKIDLLMMSDLFQKDEDE